MSEHNIKGIMDTTMDKLRAMVDADTIIGTPLTVGDITLIPVSKAAFGLATGGSDFPSKSSSGLFGGGGGAGVSITPVAFLAVSKEGIRVLPIYNDLGTVDKAINMAPELIDKVKGLFNKDK
ncbi:MAG: GerW family sporulation protein [Clostridia bacterium]|nr:GerW family sporulation protein [Clostridia bacterium]